MARVPGQLRRIERAYCQLLDCIGTRTGGQAGERGGGRALV